MKLGAILVAAALLILLAGVVLAQDGLDYDLSWHTINGGGAMGLSAPAIRRVGPAQGYTLSGTAGQPDAGVLAGGGYAVGGGFWGGRAAAPPSLDYDLYLPLVVR